MFSQELGKDFDEVFSPEARFTKIRSVLAISATLKLEVHTMDVKTVFLNGDLGQDIYMRQPPGYVFRIFLNNNNNNNKLFPNDI